MGGPASKSWILWSVLALTIVSIVGAMWGVARFRASADYEAGRMDLVWAAYGIAEYYERHARMPSDFGEVVEFAEATKRGKVDSTGIRWTIVGEREDDENVVRIEIAAVCTSPGGQTVRESFTIPPY